MRSLPQGRLDTSISKVWRISGSILAVIVWLLVSICFALPLLIFGEGSALKIGVPSLLVLLACLLIFVLVLPAVRYARFRYEVSDYEIDIMKGIIIRKRTIIPLIRVQNVDTWQGPLMRSQDLAQVRVTTAAGHTPIPGLKTSDADALRDRIAELARIAQEDV